MKRIDVINPSVVTSSVCSLQNGDLLGLRHQEFIDDWSEVFSKLRTFVTNLHSLFAF